MNLNPRRSGFTVIELLIVVSVIGLLTAILLPSILSAKRMGVQADTVSRMRQINQWMTIYADDNKGALVPSSFDYRYPGTTNVYRGKVRSRMVREGEMHEGTWADILWTENGLATFPLQTAGGTPISLAEYEFDSPDRFFYENYADSIGWEAGDNPLRSQALNTANDYDADTPGPTPYGDGAQEAGDPGYFAANDIFRCDPLNPAQNSNKGYYSTTRLRQPSRSMYLVDSLAGETIAPVLESYDVENETSEVDLRYGDQAVILLLDGHTESIGGFLNLDQLERANGNDVKIRDLFGN